MDFRFTDGASFLDMYLEAARFVLCQRSQGIEGCQFTYFFRRSFVFHWFASVAFPACISRSMNG